MNNFCYVNLMFQRKGSWSFHFRARMRQGENLTSPTQVHIIIILYVHAGQAYIVEQLIIVVWLPYECCGNRHMRAAMGGVPYTVSIQ